MTECVPFFLSKKCTECFSNMSEVRTFALCVWMVRASCGRICLIIHQYFSTHGGTTLHTSVHMADIHMADVLNGNHVDEVPRALHQNDGLWSSAPFHTTWVQVGLSAHTKTHHPRRLEAPADGRDPSLNENEHSSSQPSVHKALTCPSSQSARVLAPSLFGDLLAPC